MNEHHERDILKFIFNKVSECDINDSKLECDNATILEKLCAAGLISEQQRLSVTSCETFGDKNK